MSEKEETIIDSECGNDCCVRSSFVPSTSVNEPNKVDCISSHASTYKIRLKRRKQKGGYLIWFNFFYIVSADMVLEFTHSQVHYVLKIIFLKKY